MKFLAMVCFVMFSQFCLASGQGACSDQQLKKGCSEAKKNCRTEERPVKECHKVGTDWECDTFPNTVQVCDYYCACGHKVLEDGNVIEKIIKVWNSEDQALLSH